MMDDFVFGKPWALCTQVNKQARAEVQVGLVYIGPYKRQVFSSAQQIQQALPLAF